MAVQITFMMHYNDLKSNQQTGGWIIGAYSMKLHSMSVFISVH